MINEPCTCPTNCGTNCKCKTRSEIGDKIREIYRNAHGTDKYNKLSFLSRTLTTDSIAEICNITSAYWLVDAINIYNTTSFREQYRYQLWYLTVKDTSATLTMQEDNGQPLIINEQIPYTDFPEGTWKFYIVYVNKYHNLLMCPGDY